MRTIIILFCILFSVLGCGEKESQSASEYSDSLIIIENASNLKYNKLQGTDQVLYKLIAQYPATEVISELNCRLKTKGWKPLKIDWLNPDIPTSHERGWTNFIDGTKNPNLEVHVWNSDWTNKDEDILMFDLRYSYPENTKSEMLDLQVIGIYIPSSIAKKQLAPIIEYKKSIDK
ncbi:MAG: hypothetical protein GY705_31455 [Bacteroidetes bacterium]|nr:hypothetical protein [Bacteroidota bacterium]